MTSSEEQPEANTYVLDAESAMEMARLMRQDHLVTEGMGGLFPEALDLTDVQRILDLACGPGGWALGVGQAHRDIEVVGIDLGEKVIAYAQAQARVLQRDNVTFQVANILKPLPFPDQSFDLVNARLLVGFMRPDMWPALLEQSLRVLRPGGILRFTDIEWGLSNKPAFERACGLINRAMKEAGYTFSPNGLHLGLLPVLPRLLRRAGVERVRTMAHAIDFSADMPNRDSFYHDASFIFAGIEPLMEKVLQMPSSDWQALTRHALAEMFEEDFCGMWVLLTAYGYKPAEKPGAIMDEGAETHNTLE